MKKVLVMVALVMISVIVYAFNDSRETNQGKKEVTDNGEVVVMNKEMFLKDVFDYEKSKEWNYKGNKPAIIDLYADWCGPCRQTAPIMKELAKEYAGKIVIYKVNVDKQKELAALFNATSIPLFVFIAYQMMFAIITPALITGAFTNRVRFSAYMIFLTLWQIFVYYPFVHMIWGGGMLAQWGVFDFAGGITVHATAGFAALASVLYVGKRKIKESGPHSIP